jgi:hypothetical protein
MVSIFFFLEELLWTTQTIERVAQQKAIYILNNRKAVVLAAVIVLEALRNHPDSY